MFDNFIEKAKEYLNENEDLELVEIIESSEVGTPRKAGAFMFVDKNAESFGSVGGGNVEYQSTLYARDLLLKKEDGEKKYVLNPTAAENIGMVCGGENLMRFTYLSNNEKSFNLLNELREKNKSKNTVYIFGGGHVSMELAKILKYVGFEYSVWDDREEFANRERFPEAKQIVCAPFENILDKFKVTKNDMAVIMTRGHVGDYDSEKQMLKSDACYIGVIGSNSKNQFLREKLMKDGFTEEELNRVCAPVGLQIAADTPEEIAIAITAELIMFRSRLEGRKKVMGNNSLVELYKEKIR